RDHIARMCGGYQGSLPRLPALYPGIRCPALVLWGARDKHFPLAHAARLHAAIGGSEFEVLPGGAHWMAWHAADEVALRILRLEARHADDDHLAPAAGEVVCREDGLREPDHLEGVVRAAPPGERLHLLDRVALRRVDRVRRAELLRRPALQLLRVDRDDAAGARDARAL